MTKRLAIAVLGILLAAEPTVPTFDDAAPDARIGFRHVHGGSGKKYLVETMGSGVCLLDYNRDGWTDIYFVQSGAHQPPRQGNQLYRNRGEGSFELARQTGAEDTGYGMGCSAGDYDNDGWDDLYVTNFGPNVLLRNRGDGTFEDRGQAAGVADPSWSVSSAFADVDQDGDLDLYVGNYLEFTYATHIHCGDADAPSYCHPDVYPAAANTFYLNQGGGRFRVSTAQSGLSPRNPAAGKTLGVIFFDMDDDGDVDLYAANDSTPNYLFENNGQGGFEDVSIFSGAAYNRDGATEAGMGVDAGDVDGNGLEEMIVSHLDFETNTLYFNQGNGYFLDGSNTAGIGGPSRTLVGFGVNFGDFNLDGTLDLFVANGHVIDDIARKNPTLSHAQSNQLLINRGQGRFQEASAQAGKSFRLKAVSRGSAAGDLDNDGDLDLVVSNNNGPAALLMNRLPKGNWLQVKLRGRHCNRSAIGARAWLEAAGKRMVREARSGTSYASQNDFRLHFGLGAATLVKSLEVRWPCGRRQKLENLAGGQIVNLEEPG